MEQHKIKKNKHKKTLLRFKDNDECTSWLEGKVNSWPKSESFLVQLVAESIPLLDPKRWRAELLRQFKKMYGTQVVAVENSPVRLYVNGWFDF